MTIQQTTGNMQSQDDEIGHGFDGLCLSGYIVGPPIYWNLLETVASVDHYACALGTVIATISRLFPSHKVRDKMEKSFTDLLSEELRLRQVEAVENCQQADVALLEAKMMVSQYKMEADKCNSGMETCEEAREKAEAALETQKELTEMWERRARQKGWREAVPSNEESHVLQI